MYKSQWLAAVWLSALDCLYERVEEGLGDVGVEEEKLDGGTYPLIIIPFFSYTFY